MSTLSYRKHKPIEPRKATDDFESSNPGRDVQRVGTAAFLGEEVRKIHDPVWAVLGKLGDSQCYLGVQAKVAAVQAAMSDASPGKTWRFA